MKPVVVATLLALSLSAPVAVASPDREACTLVGRIQESTQMAALEGSAAYAFEVVVESADGDPACAGHVGDAMSLDLVLPTAGGAPKAGDRLAYARIVDGTIGGGGSINYEFQALNPPAAAN